MYLLSGTLHFREGELAPSEMPASLHHFGEKELQIIIDGKEVYSGKIYCYAPVGVIGHDGKMEAELQYRTIHDVTKLAKG